MDNLSLSSRSLEVIRSQESRLADLQPPADLAPQTRTAITDLVQLGFVFAFRIVMLICAGLSVLSAAIAWRMIPEGGAQTGQ